MRAPAMVAAVLLATGVLVACGNSSGDTDADGRTRVVFWHGQVDVAKEALDALVEDFNKTHPKIHVESDSGGVTADQMLPKVTAALAAGTFPDISYLFGSDLAEVARSSKVQNLTDAVRATEVRWDDFWPAAREAATVDGRVRAVPALTDNLAVVYNKKLFTDAGVPEPSPDWTWEDFRAVAKKLTSEASGNYGTGWPAAGLEDTTWRLWPMIWQQGGDILTADRGRTAFQGGEGVRSLSLLKDMAVTDKSVYADTDASSQKMIRLFNDGKMGMLMGGPWLLPDIKAVGIDYGVAPLPGFGGNHLTIGGSDNWLLFDHGDARAAAAREFAFWLTQSEQEVRWMDATGSLPLRNSTTQRPEYASYRAKWPNLELWLNGLPTMRSRPTLAAYPKISKAVGEAIVSVLLGQADPAPALSSAAAQADQALAERK